MVALGGGVAMLLLLVMLLHATGTHVPLPAPLPRAVWAAEQPLVWPTWAFSFVIRWTPTNSTMSTVSTGAEYFSSRVAATRRDWVQRQAFPWSSLTANASGSEFLDWTARSRHTAQVAVGDWTCKQTPLPANASMPTGDFLSTATRTGATLVVRGVLCEGWAGVGSNRPGPAAPEPASAWTMWVSTNASGSTQVPMQLDLAGGAVMDLWNWHAAPGTNGGMVTAFSIPSECPVEAAPSAMGYTLCALFIAILFTSIATVRRKADGSV